MSKSKMIFALAGFALAAALAVPAQAAPPRETEPPREESECPGGFNLISVNKAADQQQAKQVDKDGNQDQYVCEKSTQGTVRYSDNKKKKKP
jgi:hypothetical protein